jgi:hypothetical protein
MSLKAECLCTNLARTRAHMARNSPHSRHCRSLTLEGVSVHCVPDVSGEQPAGQLLAPAAPAVLSFKLIQGRCS